MKVKLLPPDPGGSAFYRIEEPARVLQSQGHDVEVIHEVSAVFQDDAYGDSRVVGCAEVDADVVVIQRPLHRDWADIIPHLQAQGIAVVVELDDDFFRMSKLNAAYATSDPKKRPRHNWNHLRRAIEAADLVTVTTPELAKLYGPRTVTIPNFIPESHLTVEGKQREGIHLGWSGSVQTHPADLYAVGNAVRNVLDNTGASFTVIGTGAGVGIQLKLDADFPRFYATKRWVSLEAYPRAMASIDVGIVPLEPSRFNQGKSYLKGLEFAAVGVPFVASPTEPYRMLSQRGIGELARRPSDWESKLTKLVTDRPYREDRAAAYREAASKLTIERNAEQWLEAWSLALVNAARNTPFATAV